MITQIFKIAENLATFCNWNVDDNYLAIQDQGLSSIAAKESELLMEPPGHIPGFDLQEFLASMISGQSLDFLPT